MPASPHTRRKTPSAPTATPPVEWRATPASLRSEEHTSELQSRLHLVCRLLLEKKKKHSHIPTSASVFFHCFTRPTPTRSCVIALCTSTLPTPSSTFSFRTDYRFSASSHAPALL